MTLDELKEFIKNSKYGIASTNKIGLNPSYYHCFVLDENNNIHGFKTDEFAGSYAIYLGIIDRNKLLCNELILLYLKNLGTVDFDKDFIENKEEFIEGVIKKALDVEIDNDCTKFIIDKKLILKS